MTAAARAGGATRASRRRALKTAAAGVIAAAAVAPALAPTTALAAAGKPGRVCAERAIVRETPGGLVVGVLEQDDLVRVLKRDKSRAWLKVSVDLPAIGWLKAKALCGR